MESSDAETAMVDCGVGTIVWVRRRNGSWWPGKILGPDELPASHLMSPRSGTPVKLLGREDASVDWYNLEKSKRVKPFRCGEFDDCIERAEASQGMPPKKREKYARREDAILHALELEKQVLEKKYGKSGVQSNTKLLGKDTTTITPELSRDNGKHVDLSLDDKRKGGLSFQSRRADIGSHLNVDDVPVRPGFRGLQDLGSGPIPIPIPFKHKLSSLAASNGSNTNAASDGLTPENTVIVSSKKLLEKKRKRSQEGNMEESVGKRRDRHRPLVQVLLSSAKLPHHTHLLQSKADGGREEQRKVVHHAVGGNDPGDSFEQRVEISVPKSFPVAWSEDNTTGSNEDTETDSSGTESLISDTYDAMAALSDEGEEDMEFIPKAFGRCEGQGADEESTSDDKSGDSVVRVSKWQMKGKRNSRSSSLRKSKEEVSMSSCSHWMMESWRNKAVGFGYGSNDDDMRRRRRRRRHSHGSGMLIDVEVGVQSGYRREHVPMISLMSKLNDKAIVGHPIPVEPLPEASSDIILSHFHESFPLLAPSASASDPTTPLLTAKPRVSRPPHLSTSQEQEEEEEEEDDDDEEEEEYYVEDGKQSARSLNHSSSSKGIKSASPKKPQRRTTSSCSSQKIRTLSSIGGTHHHHQSMDMKAAAEEGIGMMMMMKPESLPTAVACIPVKLVFSRLHEELLVARHQ